jgi:hypothetical protein
LKYKKSFLRKTKGFSKILYAQSGSASGRLKSLENNPTTFLYRSFIQINVWFRPCGFKGNAIGDVVVSEMQSTQTSLLDQFAYWMQKLLSKPGDEDEAWQMAKSLHRKNLLEPAAREQLADLIQEFEVDIADDGPAEQTA